jgi:hypothetical protein
MEKLSKEDVRTIAIMCVVLAIIAACVIGWLLHKDHKKAPLAHKAASGIYADWATDDSSLSGLTYNYPYSWTDVSSHSICTGALLSTLTPASTEAYQIGTGAQYYLEIERYGTESSNCKPDGTTLTDMTFSSIDSVGQLQSGIFKGDWLTFFSGGNTNYTTTEVDTAVLTPHQYTGSQTFTSADTVTYKKKTYQVSIVTSTTQTQNEVPVSIDISTFKATQLYKDTLNIFDSLQAN